MELQVYKTVLWPLWLSSFFNSSRPIRDHGLEIALNPRDLLWQSAQRRKFSDPQPEIARTRRLVYAVG
jgi:hypothetical protein